MKKNKQWYWLAINGASVAACTIPTANPTAVPTPEQYIGYKTRDEQLAAQKYLLTAPIEDANGYMSLGLPLLLRSGEAVYRRPKNPEAPTTGQTLWLMSPE